MFSRLALVPLCFLLFACAHTPGKFTLQQTPQAVVWPPEANPARYQLQGYLVGEENYVTDESSRKTLSKVLGWIVGLAFGEDEQMRLARPQSGIVDARLKRIYVTDSSKKAVFVFDEVQGRTLLWQDAGDGRGFKTPIGIAIDSLGQVYVADADLGAIIVLDTEGKYRRQLGLGSVQRPTGLAMSPQDELWVADSAAHKLLKLDRDGQVLAEIGGPGDANGRFKAPTHLAYRDERLYVADTLNARVQIFSNDGKFLNTFGKRGIYLGNMPRPKGVAVDPEGRVYVVESYYDYLLVYDGQGQPLLPIGGSGKGPGQFYLPTGVWADDLGRVFVADMFNGRVAVIDYLSQQTAPAKAQQQNSVHTQ